MRQGPPSVVAALILLLAGAAWPAGAAEEEEAEPPQPVLESGTGSLRFEGRDSPLPYTVTPRGLLVDLRNVVVRLGGSLDVGPLVQSHTFVLHDVAAVIGPGSSAMTVGRDIVSLPQPPRATATGLHVPVEALERLYGTSLGYNFLWEPVDRALRVTTEALREIPVTVDVVHLQGVSTVVLQFGEQPRHRVRHIPGAVEVEVVGDQLRAAGARSPRGDPLVRRVEVERQRVRVELEGDAVAEEYVLTSPFRVVLDVYRRAAAAPAPAAPYRPPVRPPGIHTLVIDPGHGGSDTGAVGDSGVTEKELTLQLARALESRLEARLPIEVILTREEDQELSLDARSALANQVKADLFLSLHLNSARGERPHGAETYFMSLEASDERAARLAEFENRSAAGDEGGLAAPSPVAPPAVGGTDPLYDLRLVLWDLAQSHYLAQSQEVAKVIQEELNQALGLADRGVKQAPFRVLRGAAMPAVLVELGFLSNPEEEAELQSAAYRAELVEALVRAVSRYKARVDAVEATLSETLP